MREAGILVAMALFVAGCASGGGDTRSEPAKPTFTAEEKAAMTSDEKVAIYNATAEEEEQVICRRQVVTGSHMKKTVCRTSAQIKADQDAAHETMLDAMRGSPSNSAGDN